VLLKSTPALPLQNIEHDSNIDSAWRSGLFLRRLFLNGEKASNLSFPLVMTQ
jgi:hypothetical protein